MSYSILMQIFEVQSQNIPSYLYVNGLLVVINQQNFIVFQLIVLVLSYLSSMFLPAQQQTIGRQNCQLVKIVEH